MRSSHFSAHFDATEEIRISSDSWNHTAIWIGEGGEVGLVLPDRNGSEQNAAFLRKLAAAALDLADDIVETRTEVAQ